MLPLQLATGGLVSKSQRAAKHDLQRLMSAKAGRGGETHLVGWMGIREGEAVGTVPPVTQSCRCFQFSNAALSPSIYRTSRNSIPADEEFEQEVLLHCGEEEDVQPLNVDSIEN